MRNRLLLFLLISFIVLSCKNNETENSSEKYSDFEPTEETARPWVYWYWMHNAYSKEGITADLEAMADAGIGGAYLMSIKGPTDPPLIDPPIHQLSEEWWEMVSFAMEEAKRLDLKIAMHAADGFAVAGGPWITPENSMQKVVWADTLMDGGQKLEARLPKPEDYEGYYKDIATFAIPREKAYSKSSQEIPKVTSSLENETVDYLAYPDEDGNFRLSEKGYIQYEFEEPFPANSIQIETKGNNYQSHRLIVETSEDGKNFEKLTRLIPPRHGWQDTDFNYTHSIPPVESKYYRFVYDPEGTEPGSEDLDAAKWKQSLKVSKITLQEEALIDNFEGKSGAVWRISPRTKNTNIPDEKVTAKEDLINITEYIDEQGNLDWEAPQGNWRIIRFGHTSTGHKNETGGAGKGLEVDKFNPEAIRFQFDKWFGEAARQAGPDVASEVLTVFHIDSWEAGSQNWSPVFQEEFKKRRGYDLVEYLPVMAGIPIEDVETSEQVLTDVRHTISELITDNFFGAMAEEADKRGAKFSSENVAPTMVSDALLHFKNVDYPAGEFWLRSPTHDKPNDMLDAISAGHIYGKDIIQAEAYTQLRMDWDEHPGSLKTLGDLHYALGVNRFFYHVFVHNPWTDRMPGMTLDGIGTYFQRNQTWWEPGKAFFDYASRVQYKLQQGNAVVDLAVFTGEEIPSRAVLPDRLLPFLPGIFGEEKVEKEEERLKNEGQPVGRMPKEVSYSKNTTNLTEWVNPLNGYKYDSFNRDVLLNDAKVVNGKVRFKGGVTYSALLFPGSRKMSPNKMVSLEVAEKISDLTQKGATVFLAEKPEYAPGYISSEGQEAWEETIAELWGTASDYKTENDIKSRNLGEGRIIRLPFAKENFSEINIAPDVVFPELSREKSTSFAWTHRKTRDSDIYFISNQEEEQKEIAVSFRVEGKTPELYDPVFNKTIPLKQWETENGRTIIPLKFYENASLFVIFKDEDVENKSSEEGKNWPEFETSKTLDEDWKLTFDPKYHGPKNPVQTDKLFDWSKSDNDSIKHYSGTVVYEKTFNWEEGQQDGLWLHLGELANIATVKLNGKNCGTAWTFPYRVDLSNAIKKGGNTLQIEVTNTWGNRLIGDQNLTEEERLSWTTAPFRLDDEALRKSGLLGPVKIIKETENSKE